MTADAPSGGSAGRFAVPLTGFGSLDYSPSKMGARDYGRLLRVAQAAVKELDRVTKRLPARLGHRLKKAA